MAKTPFEVRLAVLETAKNLNTDKWFEHKHTVEADLEAAKLANGGIAIPLSLPVYPTPAVILATARELYAFILEDGSEPKKSS